MGEDKHTPTPYSLSDRNWRGEPDPHSWYIVGGTHFSHEDGCPCECDGGERCDCIEGCGWVSTSVAVVPGNATAGGIPKATAEFIVAACNSHAALVAALKEIEADGHRVKFHRNKRVQHHAAIARAALALAAGGRR